MLLVMGVVAVIMIKSVVVVDVFVPRCVVVAVVVMLLLWWWWWWW